MTPGTCRQSADSSEGGSSLSLPSSLHQRVQKIRSYAAQKGMGATLAAIARNFLHPFIRFNRHFIWDVMLDGDRGPSPWSANEQFLIVGPAELDSVMTPRLLEFLGGEKADYDLQGVRQGDRLLLVTIRGEYVYSGYVYFNTTAETRRQKKIYAETDDTPIIGTCRTTPTKIWDEAPARFSGDTSLSCWLQAQQPASTDLDTAYSGFRNLGQFVFTTRLAYSLNLSFSALKTKVIGGKTLWHAVKELKPDVDAMAEVRAVWEEASIHRRVLNDLFRYLRQMGCRRAMNEVLAHNESSHKANIAVGMRVRRELVDWTICKHLMLQQVVEEGRSHWRVFLA